ncbi:Ribosomal RNA small subunit methyltransferase I,SAM-dependent 16S ribosomal RNA C1402 ribose 2'-O-methyltransferase,putative S-adenosylmethionine-dependent methyltransferase, YraL family,Tetrapyrrole (Corrin/Porphyrin) Methylases [Chlamydia serpentis]|uniref:Tetrapyrrole methylase domain-containing protein n=1 Tax=Chlamydia serpentis TaxID=1967782 RepID=A0A2R8FAS0_9CHLA|nr:SAM-dependent methyltransferase [Chlamydia serpentis]SPN73519.1 Ribosomal RNA small subunit methyltransferase I,SAM-dependent 16S ribosomal RNA C1402 ribose 2'-O-methyltransferase,putative S-adenosylmethionine-dependent methyltransferase, YraL family,Tetrapyrrole (Corrin/Porphyrin) Methylases [Chlamydia serpentis]
MTLYLFPNTLGNRDVTSLPAIIGELIHRLNGLIVESDRGGRAFLSLWKLPEVHKFPLAILSKHVRSSKAWDFYLEPIVKHGETWGLISDAGLPCIADPGASLVRRARALQIPIQAFSGPCSITLALMLSGLPSQNFTFLGYLPQNPKERIKSIKKAVASQVSTLVCIETPYRNVYTFESLLDSLPSYAELCVASDLSGESELVLTRLVKSWRCIEDLSFVKQSMTKVPTIFLFHIPK